MFEPILPLANLDGLVHSLFPGLLFWLDHRVEFGILVIVEEEFGKVVFLECRFLLNGRDRGLGLGCRGRSHP